MMPQQIPKFLKTKPHQQHRNCYIAKHEKLCKSRTDQDFIEDNNQTYHCKHCNKVMHDKGNHGRHESICGQYRKYIKDGQCLFCGKCFNEDTRLVYHVKNVHKEQIDPKVTSDSLTNRSNNRMYHESICRASKIEAKLPVVIRFTKRENNCKLTELFGIDDKNCVFCQNQDLQKNHWKAIQQIQGGCNIKIMKCDGPDQRKQTLKSRNGKNYQRGPKMTRYQCQYCNKIINDKGNHARHEISCSRFGRYAKYVKDGKCMFCSKTSSQNVRYLYFHIMTDHKDQIDTEVLQESTVVHLGSYDESLKCKYCGKKYRMAVQRKYHETICNGK